MWRGVDVFVACCGGVDVALHHLWNLPPPHQTQVGPSDRTNSRLAPRLTPHPQPQPHPQIFTRTCDSTRKIALTLRNLGFGAVPIHGQMSQPKRLGALNKFKAGERQILVATDVAARGLDIPSVDVVVNYDVPANSKDYVHRWAMGSGLGWGLGGVLGVEGVVKELRASKLATTDPRLLRNYMIHL